MNGKELSYMTALIHSKSCAPLLNSYLFKIPTLLFQLCILFNIAFAKGGFGLFGSPVTNGYIVFVIYIIFSLPILLSSKRLFLRNTLSYALTLPFSATFILTTIVLGVDVNLKGLYMSQTLSFVIFPFLFMIIVPAHFNRMTDGDWNGVFVFAIRFAIWFGLFNFIYIHTMGYQVNIPWLIVNLGDIDFDPGQKDNLRGSVYKLISSYNNGNIFGVCMCMLMPLYFLLERSIFNKYASFIATFLSLSRTVWIGLVLCLFYFYIRSNKSLITNISAIVLIILFVQGLIWATNFIGVDTESFLFDKNLGARVDQLDVINSLHMFPYKEIGNIAEIVYTSILNQFGIVGFIFFIIFMAAPLLCAFLGSVPTECGSAAAAGMMIYCVLCGSDGALPLAPVMWIYNFLGLVALSKPLTHDS